MELGGLKMFRKKTVNFPVFLLGLFILFIIPSSTWAEEPFGGLRDPNSDIYTPLRNLDAPSPDSDLGFLFPKTQNLIFTTMRSKEPPISVTTLKDLFAKEGFFNNNEPPYDFSDPLVAQMYKELQQTLSSEVPKSHASASRQIETAVKKHLKHHHGDNALIIINGAVDLIRGAIPNLEQDYGATYIFLTQAKASSKLVLEEDVNTATQKEALKAIKEQMTLDLGIVKYLGYNNIEEFLEGRQGAVEGKNIIVGIEKTSYYDISSRDSDKRIYNILEEYINKIQPESILYIGQQFHVEGSRDIFKSKGSVIYPRSKFLIYAAKEKNIPVEFDTFDLTY